MSLSGILVPKAYPESLKPLQQTSSLQEIRGMEEPVEQHPKEATDRSGRRNFPQDDQSLHSSMPQKGGGVVGGLSLTGAHNATGGPGLPPSLNKDTFGGNATWADYCLL